MNELDNIPAAIEAIRRGEVIIVVDDEDRENEGDFLVAARHATPEVVNFMATHGRGLICAPLVEDRCDELDLELMVPSNNAAFETPFTVSVDLLGHGCTTGISAQDRAKTIKALINPATKNEELGRPGHIFPLRARRGGVLRRAGHTEAAIDFSRLAGFEPAGVIVEIMNEDGTMARLPQLLEVAEKFNLRLVSIEDLVSYRMQHDSLILKRADTEIQTRFGEFRLRAYQQTTNSQVHVALTKGSWDENDAVLTRINSSQISNDILSMLSGSNDGKNYLQSYLDDIFGLINTEGKGAVLFINQSQQSENLLARIKELTELQLQGEMHKVPPMKMDYKDFGIGAQILHDLRISKLKVISNSSQGPRVGITGYGLEIKEYVKY